MKFVLILAFICITIPCVSLAQTFDYTGIRDRGIRAAKQRLDEAGSFAFSADPINSFRKLTQSIDNTEERDRIDLAVKEIAQAQDLEAHTKVRDQMRSAAMNARAAPPAGDSIPSCVTGAGVLNSGNFFTFWFGGIGDLGKYYPCEDDPTTTYCTLEMKLMCVSDNFTITPYPYTLFCNGGNYMNDIAACYNSTLCTEKDFTDSLLVWSLEHEPVSNYTFLPICLGLEEAYRVPGHPMTSLPGCDRRYSFVYASPWCDSKTPLGKSYKDDDATKAVKIATCVLLCLAALSTFIGICRRVYKQYRADYPEDGEDGMLVNESTSLMSPNGRDLDEGPLSANDGGRYVDRFVAGKAMPVPSDPHIGINTSSSSPAAAAKDADLYTTQLADVDYIENRISGNKAPEEPCGEQCRAAAPAYIAGFFDAFDVISGLQEFMEVPKRALPTGWFDGLRCGAMLLVVFGHVLYFPQQFHSFQNMAQVKSFIESYQSVTLLPALLAVDTFFFMAGFLVMHLLMRALDAGKASASFLSKMPLIIFTYINRYLRLTPTLIFVIAVAVWVVPTTVEGPLARIYTDLGLFPHCKDQLWATALYYQNKDMQAYGCANWIWYLMCDMQCFICVPPVALLAWSVRDRLPNYVVPILLFCGIWVLYGWGIHEHPLSGEYVDAQGQPVITYVRTIDRATPYAIGVFAAMIGSMSDFIDFLRRNITLCYVLNFFAFALAIAIWNITWHLEVVNYTVTAGASEPLQYGGTAAYFLWGWPLFLLTMTSLAGFNTFFTRFLSHPVFSVLGKLTYGQYLCHPIIMNFMYASDTHFHQFQRFKYYLHCFGVAGIASIAALVLFLLIDRPVGKFCSWLGEMVGKKKKKK